MATRWRIDKIVPGGSGFTRLPDGRSAFASGALPGETVEVTEVEDRRSYVVARSLTVVEASADRVTPPCPVAQACGGCDFMHMTYEAQLRYKTAMLREALARTGGFRSLAEPSIVASPNTLGYRGRVRLQIDEAGKVGFFARESQEHVEIPGCLVAAPAVDAAIRTLRTIAEQRGRELGACEAIEIRTAPLGCPLLLRLIVRRPEQPVSRSLLAALAEKFQIVVDGEPSRLEQRWPLPGGTELEAPAEAFTQVNWSINEVLVKAVVDGALERGARRFCDLYAGAGNFTLPLLAAGLSGLAVESSVPALRAAERAVAHQNLAPKIRFLRGDVRKMLEELPRTEAFDLVVLDPPRTGAREILSRLVELGPSAVAYCACDPVTLARDLKTLSERGFVLEAVQAFDMFPQTHHFETLAWMSGPASH